MKRKLERFRIIEERLNVIEPSKPVYYDMKGKWCERYFGNTNPITVELACGRGEYTVTLATRFPDRNFIGVDVKGERIWKGSTLALEGALANAAFLRGEIFFLDLFFAVGEINEIWITFPDPRPRKRDAKRRLTSPGFLDLYKKLIQDSGFIRLKTDNTGLFEYTLEELAKRDDIINLQHTSDLYESPLRGECFDIRTRYEETFAALGEKIKYLRFQFKSG